MRGWTGRAFGLTIRAEAPILGIPAGLGGSARTATWRRVSSDALAARWAPKHSRCLLEVRHPVDGRVLRHEVDEELGHRIEVTGLGAHLVSPATREIVSAVPGPGREWQRLFFAQVLPLAAVTQGIDLFHAGAAAVDGRIFGFVAPSGTGKSSLVLHLVARGAAFATDDVLGLELVNRAIVAHPGVATASIDPHELDRLGTDRRERIVAATWADIDGHRQVDLRTPTAAAPLGALFFLRRDGGRAFRTERVRGGIAPRLLGGAFMPHYRTPDRDRTHLEVAAAVAATVPVYAVAIPAGIDAPLAAARLLDFGCAEGLWRDER